MAGLKIIKQDFLFLVSDQCFLYDHSIYGRKTQNSAYVRICSIDPWISAKNSSDWPKNMAKNDKSFADMAIGSQRPFKLWTLSPNHSWSTFSIVLACQMCPHHKNLWQKHMIAYGAQSLKIATSLVLRAQDFGDPIVCSGLLGAISLVVSSYRRSLVK